MLFATKRHTAGDRRRFIVDYRGWLADGQWIVNATVTSSSSTLLVDTISVKEGREVWFFINGGVVEETATITVTVTMVGTEIRIDTIIFTGVAP